MVRTLAGSILIQAQKPPRDVPRPSVSLFEHEALRRSVSVVIPCHNEEMNIGPLVIGLRELFGEYLYEIIPVDDNSTDATRDVIEGLAAEDPTVKPIVRTPPNGVGRALADGYRAATGRGCCRWTATSSTCCRKFAISSTLRPRGSTSSWAAASPATACC